VQTHSLQTLRGNAVKASDSFNQRKLFHHCRCRYLFKTFNNIELIKGKSGKFLLYALNGKISLCRQVHSLFGVVTSFTGTYKADQWSLTLSSQGKTTIRSHGTKSHKLVSSLPSGTFKTIQLVPIDLDLPLFWKSQCATCLPACVILYHVTGSCKGPIIENKSKVWF